MLVGLVEGAPVVRQRLAQAHGQVEAQGEDVVAALRRCQGLPAHLVAEADELGGERRQAVRERCHLVVAGRFLQRRLVDQREVADQVVEVGLSVVQQRGGDALDRDRHQRLEGSLAQCRPGLVEDGVDLVVPQVEQLVDVEVVGWLGLARHQLEPDRLAPRPPADPPAVHQLLDEEQAAPARGGDVEDAPDWQHRRAVLDLDAQEVGVDAHPHDRHLARVDEHVRDELGDDQLGRLHQLAEPGLAQALADEMPRLTSTARAAAQFQRDDGHDATVRRAHVG